MDFLKSSLKSVIGSEPEEQQSGAETVILNEIQFNYVINRAVQLKNPFIYTFAL